MSAPTGQWAELVGPNRVGQFEMVERRQVRPGDVVFSSHYGESTVTQADTYGTVGPGTTELRFGTWTDSTGSEHIRNERYDGDSLIPRKMSAQTGATGAISEAAMADVICRHVPTDYAGQHSGWGCLGCVENSGACKHFDNYGDFTKHLAAELVGAAQSDAGDGEGLPERVEYLVQWQRVADPDYPLTSERAGEWEDVVTRGSLDAATTAAKKLAEARPTRVVRRTINAGVVASFETGVDHE